ncbi:uncharacterized protein LOC128879427 isoform X1 [Hylaeus volcanicus]|uniref:uncharacterized protein LOC128879427 isoform X1 n=1 Tax=Hylaeus volcanicus TaxID=313075 RepID=UPI0023B77B3C|nr:uncharacterized protein LOC128879427 isoform X1 [Hylaeus volcanicus]
MYVIYPADELLRIYESAVRDPSSVLTDDRRPSCQITVITVSDRKDQSVAVDENRKKRKERRRSVRGQTRKTRNQRNESRVYQVTKPNRPSHDSRTMLNSRGAAGEDANPLKDLTQPGLNEHLKQHNAGALELVQTVSEFAQELGAAMESHSANVRRLVDEFRGRVGDTRVDSGGMRRVWESLLRQVEADAVAHLDLAGVLQQQLSRPTLEASFHRKLQSRKVFSHREAYEQVVAKSEEKLQLSRADYKRAYAALLTIDSAGEQELKRAYFEAHNAYVLQLRATNAITEQYQSQCLPGLLGEIAEVYEELFGLACKCIAGITEAAAERSAEQAKRYQAVSKEAQVITPLTDLQVLARSLSVTATPSKKPFRRLFVAPGPPEQIPMERINQIPSLRDELAPTSTSTLPLMEDLRREHDGLSQEISRLHDALNALIRMQRKSAESNLYTKVAELEEDISMKRFKLGEAQLYLAAIQAQKELFGGGETGQPDGVSSRKMSNGSTGSTKHKWLKAFKSLKTSSPTTPPTTDKGKQAMYHAVSTVVAMSRKSLESEGGHTWREYTYRKITPCDACGQVLRGHSRQGVRCRGCKANAHTDCIHLVQPAMCPSLAPKKSGGIPLLRRQKTQTVDDAPAAEHNVDATYQVLRQAREIRGNSTNSPPTPPTADHPPSGAAPSSARASSHPCSSSTSAPHSPQRRRERLNLRMKSLSLDSPEGTAHGRHRPRDYCPGGQRESTPPRHSDSGSINRLSPCSPGQGHGVHKHIRGAIRMSSMELPDENEKSYSSASTSPCPSPHTNNQNHMNPPGKRVLPPNNLYVALYNFNARHRDELDLKAGYKVTVIDKSEKDWWKGKCLGGRVGYFPSAYVMRVESGQKTLQVTRNLQLPDQIALLRDQIVIQVGEEVGGVAMVRCAADVRSTDHTGKEGEVLYKEILCPLKYLQEV